jgi:hypothetical protein
MKLNVYAMITVNQKNMDLYFKKGIYKTDNLNVRSFKMYGDGALGSVVPACTNLIQIALSNLVR